MVDASERGDSGNAEEDEEKPVMRNNTNVSRRLELFYWGKFILHISASQSVRRGTPGRLEILQYFY